MVVDEVLRQWVSVVVEADGGAVPEGFGRYKQKMTAYFYDDDGLITSTRAERIQREFHVLKELFDGVGLHTNVGKMVSIAFQTCRSTEGHSTEAYGIWIRGDGRTHQERLHIFLYCLECEVDLETGYLATHQKVQHMVGRGDLRGNPHPPYPGYPRMYMVSFSQVECDMARPVEGCLGRASIWTALWVHFLQCHMWYNIVALKKGNRHFLQFPQCDMFFS